MVRRATSLPSMNRRVYLSNSVLRQIENGVLTLTINRPERRNALDIATYLGLAEAIRDAGGNDSIRVIVLTGAGDHFTAGNDLKDFQSARPVGDSAGMTFIRSLVDSDLPVVAAVEGNAIGIGVTLLQHCDFVYAATTARFRIPFVALGLCPEGASSLLLARMVGQRRANDWLLRGRAFSAAEALEAGFVNGTTDPGQALAQAMKAAGEMAALPPEALRLTKRMLHHAERQQIHETLDYEVQHFSQRLASREAQDAFAAFFQARKK